MSPPRLLHLSLKPSTPFRPERILGHERGTENGCHALLATSASKSVIADILVNAALLKIVWINAPTDPAINRMAQN